LLFRLDPHIYSQVTTKIYKDIKFKMNRELHQKQRILRQQNNNKVILNNNIVITVILNREKQKDKVITKIT